MDRSDGWHVELLLFCSMCTYESWRQYIPFVYADVCLPGHYRDAFCKGKIYVPVPDADLQLQENGNQQRETEHAAPHVEVTPRVGSPSPLKREEKTDDGANEDESAEEIKFFDLGSETANRCGILNRKRTQIMAMAIAPNGRLIQKHLWVH